MTYNFDPDRWYEDERAALEDARKTGKMNEEEYLNAVSALIRRYDEMTERLNGTYQLPK